MKYDESISLHEAAFRDNVTLRRKRDREPFDGRWGSHEHGGTTKYGMTAVFEEFECDTGGERPCKRGCVIIAGRNVTDVLEKMWGGVIQ